MNPRHLTRASLLALAFSLASCGGGGGIGGTGSPMGTLRVAITDAPSCGYDAVNVTIEKVRVHQSATATDSDAGWSDIVLSPPRRVDLLSLTNGVLANLGQTSLPAGKYTQLRLVLAPNGSMPPFANSVLPSGGSETALDTPSSQQSGLKLNADITVPADKVLDVVLDFDACKSVVKRGNSGQYNLKPVITVIPILFDAGLRIVGYVDPAIATSATAVSAQASGVPVKATPPDPTGKFVLYPVPLGTYDLVVTSPGHVTAVMTGVPVISTAYTYVNSATVPIAPAAAASAPGVVTGALVPATATVRALQTFAGGPTVEIQWAPVDALTGAFQFTLPVEAPGKTAFAPNPTSLSFAPDATAAGKYRLEAASGVSTQTLDIDVNAPLPPVTFIFP